MDALLVECVRDLVPVRRWVRDYALGRGLRTTEATLAATVASELARNLVEHAGGGLLVVSARETTFVIGTLDHGPGITDADSALRGPSGGTLNGANTLSRLSQGPFRLELCNLTPRGLWVRVEITIVPTETASLRDVPPSELAVG